MTLGVCEGVGVWEGVAVCVGVCVGEALSDAVELGVGVGDRLGVLERDKVGDGDGVMDGVREAGGVAETVDEGDCEGVAVAEGVGVAETQMKGLSAPVVSFAAPFGKDVSRFGQSVQTAWPGPLHEPAAQAVQTTAPDGSTALEPGGSASAPPEADQEPSTAFTSVRGAPA